jgi:hypothetical protein
MDGAQLDRRTMDGARAEADLIQTYHARDAAKWLR